MLLQIEDGITVDARWDDEAGVWWANSREVPGLVIEALSLPQVVNEARLVLPDLLELSGK
jgi:hypothetical protein